jgi:hypothetical protein
MALADLSGLLAIGNINKNRHLLPVVDGKGKIICEGSPSRAQYLEGQPRDKRKEFPYHEADGQWIRRAYHWMLEQYPIPEENVSLKNERGKNETGNSMEKCSACD